MRQNLEKAAVAQRSRDGLGPLYRRLLDRERGRGSPLWASASAPVSAGSTGGWRDCGGAGVAGACGAAASGVRADVGRQPGHVRLGQHGQILRLAHQGPLLAAQGQEKAARTATATCSEALPGLLVGRGRGVHGYVGRGASRAGCGRQWT
jgi:hypothetical protein